MQQMSPELMQQMAALVRQEVAQGRADARADMRAEIQEATKGIESVAARVAAIEDRMVNKYTLEARLATVTRDMESLRTDTVDDADLDNVEGKRRRVSASAGSAGTPPTAPQSSIAMSSVSHGVAGTYTADKCLIIVKNLGGQCTKTVCQRIYDHIKSKAPTHLHSVMSFECNKLAFNFRIRISESAKVDDFIHSARENCKTWTDSAGNEHMLRHTKGDSP